MNAAISVKSPFSHSALFGFMASPSQMRSRPRRLPMARLHGRATGGFVRTLGGRKAAAKRLGGHDHQLAHLAELLRIEDPQLELAVLQLERIALRRLRGEHARLR